MDGRAVSNRLIVVGCGRAKLDRPAPARELYTGNLFRAARQYAEASGAEWKILSALHGLIDPAVVIGPYDYRIGQTTGTPWSYYRPEFERLCQVGYSTMPPIWKDKSGNGHDLLNLSERTVEIYASGAYAIALRVALHGFPIKFEEPLDGLTMGGRLAWYASRRSR